MYLQTDLYICVNSDCRGEETLSSHIQPDLNNVQSRTFSKETWWGHNIDNSIDNFDILFNVAEPSHFIEERGGSGVRSQSDRLDAPNKIDCHLITHLGLSPCSHYDVTKGTQTQAKM